MREKLSFVWSIIRVNLIQALKKSAGALAVIFSGVGILLSFFSWQELGLDSIAVRLLILIAIFIGVVVFSLVGLCFSNRKTVWECGNDSVGLVYGDIIKLIFKRKKKQPNYAVVVPVNSDFDTTCEHNLVAPSSIHGQWITHTLNAGCTPEVLHDRIRLALNQQGISPILELSEKEKPYGNRQRYPLGTIAKLPSSDNTAVYLLAISDFDKDFVAHSSKEACIEAIKKLITFHNVNGQGTELYLPLIGTGLSRLNLSHAEAIDMIVSACKLYQHNIHFRMNIVIRSKERSKIAISQY